MVTQIDIANKVGLHVSTVSKILNRTQGPVFNEATIRRVFSAARKLRYDLAQLEYTRHYRRANRSSVEIPVDLKLRCGKGRLAEGQGTIVDLSTDGARIADLQITPDFVPTSQFHLLLTPPAGILKHLELRGRVVRMSYARGRLQIGIEFMGVDPALRELLARACRL